LTRKEKEPKRKESQSFTLFSDLNG